MPDDPQPIQRGLGGSAERLLGSHTCDRCFSMATGYVRDTRCVGWRRSGKGGAYFLRWEPDGPMRYFCNRHLRKPRQFGKDLIVRQFAKAHPELVQEIDADMAARLKTPASCDGL